MYVRAFQQENGFSWWLWLENDRSWHVNCMWAKKKSYPVNKLYKIVYRFFCVDLSIVKPCITGKLSSRAFRKCTLLLCSDNCIKVLGDFPVGVKYLGKDKFLKSCEKKPKMCCNFSAVHQSIVKPCMHHRKARTQSFPKMYSFTMLDEYHESYSRFSG